MPDRLRAVFTGPTVRRNLVLALVVGAILNTINQGGALAAGSGIVWWRIALNFVVPFLVSSFGAWNAGRTADAEGAAGNAGSAGRG